MYKIIGADGREYGPVTTEALCEWIAQGRANSYTRVRAEGASNWVTLAELPEFAAPLGLSSSGGTGSTQPPPPVGANASVSEVLAARYLARTRQGTVGTYLSRGWDLVVSNFWLTTGATAIIILLSWATSVLPLLGPLLFTYVLLGGLDWMFLKLVRGQPVELADIFAGFSRSFVPLMVFSLVCQLLLFVGLLLLILPAFYVMVVWMLFPALLIMDKQLDFWPAMEVSRRVAQRHFWPLLGLTLLSILFVTLGVFVCLVGAILALAVMTAAVVCAYEDLFGADLLPPPQTFASSPGDTILGTGKRPGEL